jgi:hypothetical protein
MKKKIDFRQQQKININKKQELGMMQIATSYLLTKHVNYPKS